MEKLPKWPIQFLRWFCKPYYVDPIEGDLIELYQRGLRNNEKALRLKFILNVFRFFRIRYLKPLDDFQPKSSFGMVKNYLKVTFRSMRSNKLQTIFNITGLAIGIASAILIWIHIEYQLSVDQHIKDKDRIYRVVLNESGPYTPARLVKQMLMDFPELESGARIHGLFSTSVKIEDEYVTFENGAIADSTYFEVFPTTFLAGQPENALNRPNSIVLTESVAIKAFKTIDVIGRVIESDGDSHEITAVVKDPPKTSTIPYGFLISIPHEYWATTGWWTGNNFFSYVKLKENTTKESVEAKFPGFVETYIAPAILQFSDRYQSFDDYLADGNKHSFKLVPLSEIHLHHPRLTLSKPGSYTNLLIFGIVAIFIILIACINYINMSTAKATLRTKEIGMRKVMGSLKGMIARQFIVEAYAFSGIGLLIGFIISILLLPYFNSITGLTYELSDIINLQNVLFCLGLWLVLGILSGAYPAFYLSSFKPIHALKGENKRVGNSKVRKSLVVIQFAVSIILISGTLLVYLQVEHMKKRKLGLDAEQVFILKNMDQLSKSQSAFVQELKQDNNIEAVAFANQYPSGLIGDWNYKTKGDDQIQLNPRNIFVSGEIDKVWGLKLTNGRFFDDSRISDTSNVIITQEFVKRAGFKDPLLVELTRGQGMDFKVIGVVEDITVTSAKRSVEPVIFRYAPPEGGLLNLDQYRYCMIKISSNYQDALTHVEKVYLQFTGGYPFDGLFMDDSFNNLYEEERRFANLFTGFSILAILIAAIGLFALSSFTLERKLKEIAIRKVLGASSSTVTKLILKDFILLIFLSAIISVPTIFYFGNEWLANYVERISIGTVILVFPTVVVLLITLLTIGVQTFKVSDSNPVLALKQE